MRKYLAIFIVLILLLSFGCVLVACIDKEDPDKNTASDKADPTVTDVFKAVGDSMPGGDVSTDMSFPMKVGQNEYYTVGIRTNNPINDEGMDKFEFVFDIRKDSREGDVIFAAYIVNSKVYIETFGGLKVYIADFDIDFIVAMLKEIPDFTLLLDQILALIPIEGMELSTKGVIELLLPMLFDNPYMVENPDGSTSAGAEIILTEFLTSIIALVSDVGLDSTIANVLNMPYTESGTPIADFLLNDLAALVNDFPFKINFDAVLKPGETPNLNLNFLMANADTNVIDVNIVSKIYTEKQDIGIPEDLTSDIWEEYSVFNLGMDLTISASVGGGETHLNLTEIINLFAGQYETIIPPSVPLTLSLGEAGLKVSIQTQLNRYNNFENLLSIEFDGGFLNNGDTETPVLFGIYYIDNAFYIRINLNDGNDTGLFTPVIKFIGVDLSQMIDALLGGGEIIDGVPFEGLGKMIRDLILSAINKPKEDDVKVVSSNSAYRAENSNGQVVRSYNNSENPDIPPIEEPSENRATLLINKLLGIFGFDPALLGGDENGFGINLYNTGDKSFIKDLMSLVPQIGDLLGQAGNSDFIQNLGGHIRFNYGSANVGDIPKNELANIELLLQTWSGKDENGNPAGTPIEFKLVADNFRFGKPDASFEDKIRSQIQNVDIADNLSELIANIADGAKLEIGLDLTLEKGDIDLNKILEPLNISGIPKLPLLNVPTTLNLKFSLDLQFAFNAASPSTSKLSLTLQLDSITDSNGANASHLFPYMAVGTPALGIYSIDGSLYVDLSGIKIANLALPKLKADVDLMSLLAKELENIDVKFTLTDIMNMIMGTEAEAATFQSGALQSKYNNNGSFNGGSVVITKDQIAVSITSMAIMNILKEYLDLDFDLPGMQIDISVGGSKGLISIGATLKDENFINDILSFRLYVEKFNIGLNDPDFNNSIANIDTSLYESNIIEIAKDLLGHIDISAVLSMTTLGDKIDITELVNNLLAITGERLDFPIVLDIANFKDQLNLVLKWNLADNPRESELIFELFSENGKPTAANNWKSTGFHIGFYVKDGDLLLDLSQLGITKLKFVNFDVNALIDILLDTVLSGAGLDQGSLDLTTILGDLLGTTTSSAKSGEATFGDNYSAASYNASVNSVNIGDDLVNGLLDAILNNLKLQDNQVILNLMGKFLEDGTYSDPIKELLYQLGIDAGVDIGAEANVNIYSGEVGLTLGLQNVEFALNLKINGIGQGNRIDWTNKDNRYWIARDEYSVPVPDRFKFSTFADISSTSLFELILNALSNVTGDEQLTPDGRDKPIATLSTRIVNNANSENWQDLTIEIVKVYKEYSDSTMLFRKGDYRIVASSTNSDGSNKAALAVLKFDPEDMESALYLKLKSGLAGGSALVEGILNLINPIGLPITLGSLADSLPDFNLPTIGGGARANSLSSNVYAAEEDEAAFGIDSLFDKDHGLLASFGNNNDVKISADIKGAFLSNMLNDLLGPVFGISKEQYEEWINDERMYEGHSNIVNAIYDDFLIPFIEDTINIAGMDILLTAWEDDVKNVLRRVLPIPKFEEARVELNLINGAASSAKIRGWKTKADKDEDLNSTYTANKSNIAIDLINAATAKKGSDTAIDWMGQSTDIFYMLDGFGKAEQDKLNGNFVKAVWGNVDNTDGSLSIKNYADVNFNDSEYNALHNALSSKSNFDSFVKNNNRVTKNEDGTYTYNFTLRTGAFNATYSSNGNNGGALPIKITLVPYMENVVLDTLYISPTDEQPNFVNGIGTLKTNVLMNYQVTENAESLPTNVKVTAEKLIENIKPKDQGTVLPNGDIEIDGAYIKFLDQNNEYTNIPIKIVYLSDAANKFVGNFNVADSDKNELRGVLNSGNANAVTAESLKKIGGIPRVAYFKYDNSPIWRSELIATWDFTDVKNKMGESYFTAEVAATLVNGTVVNYTFNMVSDTVTEINFGGKANTLAIDPLEYWNPANWKRNPMTEALAYDKTANAVFATQADVKYADGRIVKEAISWAGTKPMPTAENPNATYMPLETFIANYEKSTALLKSEVYGAGKSGNFNVNLIVKPVSAQWVGGEHSVNIEIIDRTNPSLVFGTSDGDDVTSLSANPYDSVDALLTRSATAVYPDGKRMEVNIEKGEGSIKLPANGGLIYASGVVVKPTYYDSVRVGESAAAGEYTPNELMASAKPVPIIVERCLIEGLASSNAYMLTNISQYTFREAIVNPVSSITELFPKTMPFLTSDGKERTFEVEYYRLYKKEGETEYNNELSKYSDLKGQTISVRVRLKNTANQTEYPYEMKIAVPERRVFNGTQQRSVNVTYEDYITKVRHGLSNRISVNFGQGDETVTDTFIIKDDANFNFSSIDLTNEGVNKGYVYINLGGGVQIRMALNVTNCPDQLPIGLASGYDTITFDKTEYFKNQNEGKEAANYQSITSWKLKVVENGVLKDMETSELGATLKWEYSNISPNAANQTVTLKVLDKSNNLIGVYVINIAFN